MHENISKWNLARKNTIYFCVSVGNILGTSEDPIAMSSVAVFLLK